MKQLNELATRQRIGLDKVRLELREQFFLALDKALNIPTETSEAQALQDITKQASIGQLFALANTRKDKLLSLRLQSVDTDGTIYLTFCGMFGGMDLDGNINT
jgi:hypothetical protein